ncbi:MAG TPA: thioredoxin-dependent thiol peroxidase [Bacteroidetes bacterium]|nr:thioredoxin-dependent thiol peroxidase [Ignavibacteria bacterium]HCA42158.1 thioredoxin-dependent thiol peroxidase [Bacteroidota bacterium]HCN38228.1 thioredoxin-dependent thiol peroxidase [Bacteroidota bacterium]
MLKPGDKAPDFNLPADDGKTYSLKDFKGKKLILYFYPKDDTDGCTKEACAFRDNIKKFESKNTVVIGVSKDDINSHKKFRDKYKLNFPLISDENLDILKKYGVWQEKSMFGNKYMGIVRTTYLINEKGIIEKIWEKVKVPGHIEKLLKEI